MYSIQANCWPVVISSIFYTYTYMQSNVLNELVYIIFITHAHIMYEAVATYVRMSIISTAFDRLISGKNSMPLYVTY